MTNQKTPAYMTASEVSRELREPLSKIISAISDGRISPAGRAGASANAAYIFRADDLPAVRAAIDGNAPAPAFHKVASTQDIRAKATALRRAMEAR